MFYSDKVIDASPQMERPSTDRQVTEEGYLDWVAPLVKIQGDCPLVEKAGNR